MEAFCLDRQASRPGDVEGDLLDSASLGRVIAEVKPDCVVHLAGVTFPAHGAVEDFYRVNTAGTSALLRALADHPPGLTILASTALVYAPSADGEPISETHRLQPQNHYAASKLAMEMSAAFFADRMPLVTTRPFNYTGPGQPESFLVPKIVGAFARGEPEISLGNLDLFRDFSDVDMIVESYAAVIERAQGGDVINLCSSRSLYLADIIDWMNEIAGYAITVRTDPRFVRPNETPRIIGNNDRLRRLAPSLTIPDFQTTLERMYVAAREHPPKA